MFLAFAWFINLLWFVTAGWSMICGAEELTPQVVVTAILFFVLMFGAAITMQM